MQLFVKPAIPAKVTYPIGSTGTGLDYLIDVITHDLGLQRKVGSEDIIAGANAANAMNVMIVDAIRSTGTANDGHISVGDVREINSYLRHNYQEEWATQHGNDEGDKETGFHLVQADGARSMLYGRNAVNVVADSLYHLGFKIEGNRLLNEDGSANAMLNTVAGDLNLLLATNLSSGALANLEVYTVAAGTTGTGLDQLITLFNHDEGLAQRVSTGDLYLGARAADTMNAMIVEAIRATNAADEATIDVAEVRDINAYIRATYLAEWATQHGDDEGESETGFHLIQADGARSMLYGRNAVNVVADGLYHLGFEIEGNRLLNEDGNANAGLLVMNYST